MNLSDVKMLNDLVYLVSTLRWNREYYMLCPDDPLKLPSVAHNQVFKRVSWPRVSNLSFQA